MFEYVFARETVAVRINSCPVPVVQGAAFHRSDPVVAVHPELFSDTPVIVHRTPGYEFPAPVVEQATAAPGERRTGRRGA